MNHNNIKSYNLVIYPSLPKLLLLPWILTLLLPSFFSSQLYKILGVLEYGMNIYHINSFALNFYNV